jgi:hypothetical protein
MIQFIRKTGSENHTNDAFRLTSHTHKHMTSTHEPKHRPTMARDRDTGTQNSVTTSAQQLRTILPPRWHMSQRTATHKKVSGQ